MAQALVDYMTFEVIGQASFMQQCQVELMVLEVLGKFQYGTVDVDLMVVEVLGKTANYAQVEHFSLECIGQWSSF